jgi:Tol biopolymer transport system component
MRYREIPLLLILALIPAACTDQSTQPELGPDLGEPAFDLSPLFGSDSKIAYTMVPDPVNWTTNIFVMDPDGTGATNLTPGCSECDDPSWSPDGTKIAFDQKVDGNWEIFVMNADGSDQVRVTSNSVDEWSPVWSPNGDQLVFMRKDAGGKWDVWRINEDGTGANNLTGTTGENERYPTWSPDGSQIAFLCGEDICRMNADGSGRETLVERVYGPLGYQFQPDPYKLDWSPDGARIAFMAYEDLGYNVACTRSDLFVVNPDGTGLENLSNLGCNAGHAYQPSWSPDGTQITFSYYHRLDGPTHSDLFVIRADGSGLTQITNTQAYDVIWAPDWGLVPAPPPPPEEMIDLIDGAVEELVLQGILNTGEANALTVKLDAVKRRIDQGKVNPAVNMLGSFINQVNALVNSGRLSEADAQVLIEAAENAVSQLQG